MNITILSSSVPEVTYGSVSIWTLIKWPFVTTVTKNADTSLYGSIKTDNGFILYETSAVAGSVVQTFADNLTANAIVILQQATPTSTIPGLVGATGYFDIDFGDNSGGNSWAQYVVSDTGVSTNSNILVFIMSATTVDHTPEEHRILDMSSSKSAGAIVANVSFTVYINTTLRVRKLFRVGYTRT